MNFKNLFRSITILKYTTQLISHLLGFLADSIELESVTTMLATPLTMQMSGKSSWLIVSQANAFWDSVENKNSLRLEHEMKCFMYTSMNMFYPSFHTHSYPSFFLGGMIEKNFTMRYSLKSCQQSPTRPI